MAASARERADAVAWRPKAGEIPTTPGVYRFRDANGRILYVGKAINLRQRLSNYFQPLRSLHERTRHMVLTAASVEWTSVGSDFEALQLEYTWIKEFEPPFNVKFRDDKTYPYLALTMADEAPRVMVTRNHRIPGARYFGPYPKVWAVRETIDLMIKAFPIRTCSDSSYARAMATGRPCFPGQIGRWWAVRAEGDDRGTSGDRRPVRGVHGEPRPPDRGAAGEGDACGLGRPRLRARCGAA